MLGSLREVHYNCTPFSTSAELARHACWKGCNFNAPQAMNPALILLELCLRTQLYSNFWCNTFLVHQMVHHKLHHSWLVVHHKLHHPLLGCIRNCTTPVILIRICHIILKKIFCQVLMKYHKFNAKIWHLITFISIYCSTIVNWNLIMIYANNGHIWNEINTYLQYV